MPLSTAIQHYVDTNKLRLDKANKLTVNQRLTLESRHVRMLITHNILPFERALALTPDQRYNLEVEYVRTLIADNTFNLEWALALTPDQRCNLASRHIRTLIANNTITFEQALALTLEQRWALADDDTQQRLRNGGLTIQNIIGGQIPHREQNIPAPVNLNNAQSTHTASVHRTASESATRLLNTYHEQMSLVELDGIINNIIETINALPDGTLQNEAAKCCTTRLTAPDYTYTDSRSGVSTRQLLALTWLAIHDDTKRTSSLDEAKNLFIEGLYEIQRGYNLSEAGVDSGDSDVHICAGGTFNKLIEKLIGLHPDVTIEFITQKLASMKLPIVVKEEVKNYLAARANPSTASGFTQFTRQIKQIEEEGVEVIWDAIKGSVEDRMFNEFHSLYADNRDDPCFTDFIDAGKYTELQELPSFQKEISESEGYRQYCSTAMNSSYRMFAQERTQSAENDLSDDDTIIPQL